MYGILLLVVIVCIAIFFVKDINPQIKAIAKNILIISGILLVVAMAIVLFTYTKSRMGLSGRMIEVPADSQK